MKPDRSVAPEAFDPACTRCPRLAEFLAASKRAYPDHRCLPVPAFGEADARLLVVGLAPGLHGANRTGRPFTGDYAGVLLYATLHAHGFADRSVSVSADDGLALLDCRITNAARCVPPQNKPTPAEVRACAGYLSADLARVPRDGVIVALGRVAHETVLRTLGLRLARYPFAHGAEHALAHGRRLLDSYHCSRYNTNTGTLTPPMFDAVFALARTLLAARAA